MKIYLLANDKKMVDAWQYQLRNKIGLNDVFVIHNNFEDFMNEHKNEVDCIVSPANAFGYMDGGYDAAITDFLGHDVMHKVQEVIMDEFDGEQPVGTSIFVDVTDVNTQNMNVSIIHTPTMRVPERLHDATIAYTATRSTLYSAKKNNCKCIVVPAFGAGTGFLDKEIVARLMIYAIYLFENPLNTNRLMDIFSSQAIVNTLKDKTSCRDVFETIKLYYL